MRTQRVLPTDPASFRPKGPASPCTGADMPVLGVGARRCERAEGDARPLEHHQTARDALVAAETALRLETA